MANAAIGFDRYTRDFTFDEDGGSWDLRYPVSNLKIEPIARVARCASTALSASRFSATISTPRGIRMFGFIGHNASVNGRFRIRMYETDARINLMHDTGWLDFWPVVYPFGTLPYAHPSFWTGKYTQRYIDTFEDQPSRVVFLPQNFLCGGITVEIDDVNNPRGPFQCGLFEISDGDELPINFTAGAQNGFRFRTTSQEHLGGSKSFERRRKPRMFNGNFDQLDEKYAMARFWEFWRQNDLDIPFLWLQDPSDEANVTRNGFLAKNVDGGKLGLIGIEESQVQINIEEVL